MEPSLMELAKTAAFAEKNNMPELAQEIRVKIKKRMGDNNEMVCTDMEWGSPDGDTPEKCETDIADDSQTDSS